MKIIVLNGSPKGMTSVTMQYVHYIQQKFSQHELNIINISQRIKKIEKDETVFQDILKSIESADAVLWASPVYFLLVPANYKRFIELIFKKGGSHVFQNKHTAFLTTSIRFFDHTAHNYMHGVCDDLGMRFMGSFSADMDDLKKEKQREKLYLFAQSFFNGIKTNRLPPKSYMPVVWQDFGYSNGKVENKTDARHKKILVLTDSENQNTNLDKMVERFKQSFSNHIEVVNLWDIDIKGSCLGCIHCGYDNQCVYDGKDEYNHFYNTVVKTADILVIAGTIQDRYLSSKWKMFIDRSFFKGHAPSWIDKQIGFIISGPLSQVPNLRQIFEAQVEIQHANLCGFVTDESKNSSTIDNLLHDLGKNLIDFAHKNYVKPPTFLGIGGKKIFRDDLWGRLRFPFRADYEAFKKLGTYDFPQKKYKSRITNALMLFLSKSSKFRQEVNKRTKKEMIKPLQKVLKQDT